MSARTLVLPLVLSLALAPFASAAPGDAVKDLRKHAGQLAKIKGVIEGDDPRLAKAGELIDQVAKKGGADAAKTLLALTQSPFPSPSVEVTIAEMAKDGLAAMEDEAGRKIVYKALKKAKKNATRATILCEIASGWPTAKSSKALAELLGSKDERIVTAAARALGLIHLKESIKPLIDVFEPWQKRGGEPIEAIGRALYDITLQPLTKAADWEKWWKDSGKAWTPASRGEGGEGGGTKQRPNHFQSTGKVPKFFNSLEVSSRKIVIVMDVSGSMHIREYIEEPIDLGAEGAGSQTSAGSKLPAGDPNAEGYKPKKCTFHQCPFARGRKGATCPSDENLPKRFSRMRRLARATQRLVRSLPKNAKFNMVAYSTEARTWKGKALVSASPSNKTKAVGWLKGLQEGGVTRSNVAVDLALTFTEADTIIFVTDGAPTSAAGKPLDDKKVLECLAEVQRGNRVRKVRIDVIAIAEGHTDFATGLAEQNGGKYVTVD
jgi:hypothetical protein